MRGPDSIRICPSFSLRSARAGSIATRASSLAARSSSRRVHQRVSRAHVARAARIRPGPHVHPRAPRRNGRTLREGFRPRSEHREAILDRGDIDHPAIERADYERIAGAGPILKSSGAVSGDVDFVKTTNDLLAPTVYAKGRCGEGSRRLSAIEYGSPTHLSALPVRYGVGTGHLRARRSRFVRAPRSLGGPEIIGRVRSRRSPGSATSVQPPSVTADPPPARASASSRAARNGPH